MSLTLIDLNNHFSTFTLQLLSCVYTLPPKGPGLLKEQKNNAAVSLVSSGSLKFGVSFGWVWLKCGFVILAHLRVASVTNM